MVATKHGVSLHWANTTLMSAMRSFLLVEDQDIQVTYNSMSKGCRNHRAMSSGPAAWDGPVGAGIIGMVLEVHEAANRNS